MNPDKREQVRQIAYQAERDRIQAQFPDLEYRRFKVSRQRVLFYNQNIEDSRWIGKPWRRISTLFTYHIWKGEVSREFWSLTVHVRIFGVGFTWDITRAPGYDYEEERP